MKSSPKLKKAMAEIQAILKENDIAGFVVLHTPGFSEYLNHLETSYSCAKITPEGMIMKIDTEKLGQAESKRLADGTYSMVKHFAETIGPNALNYIKMQDYLKSKLDGTAKKGKIISIN